MNVIIERLVIVVLSCCSLLLLLLLYRLQCDKPAAPARPVPDFDTFKRLALEDAFIQLFCNIMRRVDVLILIGALSVLVLIFYPSYILHKRSKITLFERHQKILKKSTKAAQRNVKDIYNDNDYADSNEVISQKSWMDSIIIHGIHKPHLPERSQHWQRLELSQKLMGLRPWPVFSPGPRYDRIQTSDEMLRDPDPDPVPTSPIIRAKNTSSTNSSTTFQGSERIYLVKDLYKSNHFWPHSEICAKKFGRRSDGVKLLIAVTSSARNVEARRGIRFTWGHYATRKDIALVFILGRPDAIFLDGLLREDNIFRDLVLSNTPDSNMDATLKSVSLLEWVHIYCANIHAVLKVKEDVFINVRNLMGFMTAPHRLVATKTLWGKLMRRIQPERDQPLSPYFIPTNQFPGSLLPDFLLGSAYLLTIDLVEPLFHGALELPHMRLEDVFITGTLADKIRARRVDIDNFFNYNVSENICGIKKGIAFDKVQYNQQFHMWQQMHDTTIICRNVPKKKKRKKHTRLNFFVSKTAPSVKRP